MIDVKSNLNLAGLVENNGIEKVTLQESLELFYSIYKLSTQSGYQRSFSKLFSKGFLSLNQSLKQFIEGDHIAMIERIRCDLYESFTISLRRACVTAYCSFRKYISYQLGVEIDIGCKKVDLFESSKECQSLTLEEWNRFLECLKSINVRDSLIAEVLNYANGFLSILSKRGPKPQNLNRILKTALKRPTVILQDVLELSTHSLGVDNGMLLIGRTFLCYPNRIFKELCKIQSSGELVFATSEGKSIKENQLKRNFNLAGIKAGLKRKISVHTIRLPVLGMEYCPHCENKCVCIRHKHE